MKIHQNSSTNEVRRGPRGSGEGSGGHFGPQGCPGDEKYGKRAQFFPSPGTQLEAQIHTFPVVYGVVYAKWLISILSLLIIGLSIYPYAMNIYNTTYLITLVLFVQIPLVSCIFYLWKYPNSQSCVVLTTTTKYITIGGVITILTTKLFA